MAARVGGGWESGTQAASVQAGYERRWAWPAARLPAAAHQPPMARMSLRAGFRTRRSRICGSSVPTACALSRNRGAEPLDALSSRAKENSRWVHSVGSAVSLLGVQLHGVVPRGVVPLRHCADQRVSGRWARLQGGARAAGMACRSRCRSGRPQNSPAPPCKGKPRKAKLTIAHDAK